MAGKCLLCQSREATKKGSHIIPSFLMKRINSIDGCNKRDHELGFSIGLGTVETYFGRDVYEDRRKEYTDNESLLDDRTNLDTKDNVFCPECEKLFSRFENKYSQIYQLQCDKDLFENTKVSGKEAALFWYGIIWRISATSHFGIKLNNDFEEKLRKIILSEDINRSDIYYTLHYCKNYSKINPTFAFFDCIGSVALLIVDEFMINIFNGVQSTQSDEVLWGMNFKFNKIFFNNGTKPEIIVLFPVQLFQQICRHIINKLLKQIDYRNIFNLLHVQLVGSEMPDFIFDELMEEIKKAKLADMLTVPNFAFSMKRVIQAHPDIYRGRFVNDK